MKLSIKITYIISALHIFASAALFAKDEVSLENVAKSFKYESGTIALGKDLAQVKVPAGFRYLNPAQTNRLLTQVWGNPNGMGTLGMILPEKVSPASKDAWGIVITYDDSGYVSDSDADKLDYKEILQDMQKSAQESNKARHEAGFGTVNIIGWAANPHYDRKTKKIFWAKEIEFDGSREHTLNYSIRILGRTGVLELNAVAGMNQLKLIQEKTPDIMRAVEFKAGQRYEDYVEGVDKKAAYGVAALIAGGVAAKTGLLKGLWLAILAGKKFILIGAVAVGGFLWNLIRRKKEGQPPGNL